MTNQKIRRNKEFKQVFLTGKRRIGSFVVLYLLPNKQDENRIGIIVKKNIGNAVQRNKVKRKLREIWRKRCQQVRSDSDSGQDIIIVARRKIVQASFKEIEEDLEKLI